MVAENSIPADLILNWDQTGVRMVPVNARRGKIFSREDIFAGRYFRGKIFSWEDIFA